MKNITDELWNWIESNMTGDPDRLRLSCGKDHDKLFAITQIDARRRVKAEHADRRPGHRYNIYFRPRRRDSALRAKPVACRVRRT